MAADGEYDDGGELPPEQETAPKARTGRKTRSVAEMRQRIEFTAYLISKDIPPSQINAQLRNRYQVSDRTALSYRKAAMKVIAEWTERSPESHRRESLAFYRSVIQDPQANMRDKLQARARLDCILGIESPQELRLTGPDGGPVEVRQQMAHVVEVLVTSREEAKVILQMDDLEMIRVGMTNLLAGLTPKGIRDAATMTDAELIAELNQMRADHAAAAELAAQIDHYTASFAQIVGVPSPVPLPANGRTEPTENGHAENGNGHTGNGTTGNG